MARRTSCPGLMKPIAALGTASCASSTESDGTIVINGAEALASCPTRAVSAVTRPATGARSV